MRNEVLNWKKTFKVIQYKVKVEAYVNRIMFSAIFYRTVYIEISILYIGISYKTARAVVIVTDSRSLGLTGRMA